jgi:riboflavin synthase
MFTGIVEELGEVLALEPSADAAALTVLAPGVGRDVSLGASIAVDGVCLTVIGDQPAPPGRCLRFDVMAETLRRSTLGRSRPGDRSTWSARCAQTGASAVTSSKATWTAWPW